MDFDGYAIGGVSASGRAARRSARPCDVTTHGSCRLDRPRYLMGVGRPRDILDAVATGIDLFDCVLPTRNGRNATCLTAHGPVKLRNAVHKPRPPADRGGLRLPGVPGVQPGVSPAPVLANEMLGPILASVHNLAYLHRLMAADSRSDKGGSVCPIPCGGA